MIRIRFIGKNFCVMVEDNIIIKCRDDSMEETKTSDRFNNKYLNAIRQHVEPWLTAKVCSLLLIKAKVELRLHDKGTMARNYDTGFRVYERNLENLYTRIKGTIF